MRIRVSYAELKSSLNYNHKLAEAQVELEVHGDIEKAYSQAWALVQRQVKSVLEEKPAPFQNEPFL